MSTHFYKNLLAAATILAVIGCVKSGVIDDVDGDNDVQGCVGSVKVLDHQDIVLTIFKDSKKPGKPGKLEYEGEVNVLRLEGNCCFVAREKRRGGKILRLNKPGDYDPEFLPKFMEKSECPSVIGTGGIAAIVIVVVLVVLVGGVFFYVRRQRQNRGI